MLVGAGRSQTWSHHRAHRFFSHARWSIDQVCAVLARVVVRLLVADHDTVLVAIDDTLFHRRGPKVHAASWFRDGSAIGNTKIGYGNNWVILAIVVRLGFIDRPVALPVGFALVRKNSDGSRWPAGSPKRWPRPYPTGRSTWSPTPPTPARRCVVCPRR